MGRCRLGTGAMPLTGGKSGIVAGKRQHPRERTAGSVRLKGIVIPLMAPWPAMRIGSATCATRFASKSFWQLISGHSSASLGRAALMPSGTGARRGLWAVASCPSERRRPWCVKAAQQLNPAVLPRHCPRRSFDNSKKRGALESGALESGALESGARGRAERREGRSAGKQRSAGKARSAANGGAPGKSAGNSGVREARSAGKGGLPENGGLPARGGLLGNRGAPGKGGAPGESSLGGPLWRGVLSRGPPRPPGASSSCRRCSPWSAGPARPRR